MAGLIASPFLEPWRAAQPVRRTASQQARRDALEALASRTDAEETEFLTLSWFTDHARARGWTQAAARTLRPVNYAMNALPGPRAQVSQWLSCSR